VAAGPRVEKNRGEWACAGRVKAGPREGEGRRVGLAGLSSLFLLLSFFFSILKLFKHNYSNSIPINSTQGKQCYSMNAETC
jgi:hypothetical protein